MPEKADIIRKLKRQQSDSLQDLLAAVKASRERVAGKIVGASSQKNIATSFSAREKLYREISDYYDQLGKEIDRWGKVNAKKTAMAWHDEAVKDIFGQAYGEHTPEGMKKVIKYLERETGRKFTPHGSVAKGIISKNDLDIAIVPYTEKEQEKMYYEAMRQQAIMYEKLQKGEITQKQFSEYMYGEAENPNTQTDFDKAMEEMGYKREGTAAWMGVAATRFTNKKTGHSIEIWEPADVGYEDMKYIPADDLSKKADAAIKAVIKQETPIIRFDKERVKNYWQMIHPDNSQSLAAVFTNKMAAEDIRSLRQAYVEVFRQASIEGLTNVETNKALQERWNELAGDISSDRFVDKAGRTWDNARYFQMLVRTTTAKVARESYIDTIIANEDDLMRIVNVGETCELCLAWADLIISTSGTNPDFPSYQDALDAGWGHPNCDCMLERVDETIDADDIERQSAAKNPKDWSDENQVQKYKESFE